MPRCARECLGVPSIEVKSSVPTDRAPCRGFDYDGGVGRWASILALGLSACASSVPRTVPRIVDGEIERGPPVAPYAYEWFIEGERLAVQGRHDDAAIAFETATAAPTGDVLLVTRLAEEYELSGATRRADRALSSARRSYPSSARVALAEGRIRRSRGQADEALAAFIRATRRAPTWSEPLVAMAHALAARGHFERASTILLEYLEIAPKEGAQAARRALVDLARRTDDPVTLARALAFEPGATPAAASREGARLALAGGRPALAARLVEGALDTEDNIALWLDALAQSGAHQEATRFLVSPRAARWATVEDRAHALLDLHEEERTLELLAAAARSPRVQHARGRAFLEAGKYLEAAATLAGVPLGTSPYETSRVALAECAASQGRRGAAAETLSATPHASLPVRRALAALYVDAGDLRAGLRLFDPKDQRERAALASIFERAGRYEEAAAYYASVRITASGEPRLRARASAEQLASRGLYPGAIEVLERWTAHAPSDLHSRVRLVELLQKAGREEEASSHGKSLVEIIDDPRLRAHLRGLLRTSETGAR